jgi:hypothetical protein
VCTVWCGEVGGLHFVLFVFGCGGGRGEDGVILYKCDILYIIDMKN